MCSLRRFCCEGVIGVICSSVAQSSRIPHCPHTLWKFGQCQSKAVQQQECCTWFWFSFLTAERRSLKLPSVTSLFFVLLYVRSQEGHHDQGTSFHAVSPPEKAYYSHYSLYSLHTVYNFMLGFAFIARKQNLKRYFQIMSKHKKKPPHFFHLRSCGCGRLFVFASLLQLFVPFLLSHLIS